MQAHIHHLMKKEMSRKEFLATVAFGLATLIGFSTLLQLLGKQNPWQPGTRGYGTNNYAGSSSLRKE